MQREQRFRNATNGGDKSAWEMQSQDFLETDFLLSFKVNKYNLPITKLIKLFKKVLVFLTLLSVKMAELI